MPVVLLAVVVGLAFPFTATSLWTGMQTDTPLAYQGLIPFLAFLTAAGQSWRKPSYVWRDWLTELVVATPFLAAAVAIMFAGPRLGSIYFWFNRNDLLALACFGVAAAVILFGVGAVTRSWFAVAYLFLLWPAPYRDYLTGIVDAITVATVGAVEGVLGVVNVQSVTPLGNAVFRVAGPDGAQLVGVDSPCAGAAGIFGFLIVAIPALYLLGGRLWRKAAWLSAGLALLWTLNLARIFALFSLAATYGAGSDAFYWAHALLGLLLFGAAMLLLYVLGARLGFRIERGLPVEAPPTMLRVRGRRAALPLVGGVVVVAGFLGGLNVQMVDAVGLSTTLDDDARIGAFADAPPRIGELSAAFVDDYPWARQFFGRDSTFRRFVYRQPDGPSIWVDSVVTPERNRLDLYNVQGCYSFHGYDMRAVSTVDLGYGIVARQIQFVVAGSDDQWVALSWTWPVVTERGNEHERLTIFYRVRGVDTAAIDAQDTSRGLLERLFGIGNGKVAAGPEARELHEIAARLVRRQIDTRTAVAP